MRVQALDLWCSKCHRLVSSNDAEVYSVKLIDATRKIHLRCGCRLVPRVRFIDGHGNIVP